MPTIPHIEQHFTATETVRDVVIGMADGLTVPFALAAGLSAAVSDTAIIMTAGLAEIAAGAIAMGLGGYLAARTDAEHYVAEETRECAEIESLREREVHEVEQIFQEYGLSGDPLRMVVAAITEDRGRWIDFMMRFELGLERPHPTRAPISAATIGLSYLVGGLIPLSPYIFTRSIHDALWMSVLLTAIALLVFGAIKGQFTGLNKGQVCAANSLCRRHGCKCCLSTGGSIRVIALHILTISPNAGPLAVTTGTDAGVTLGRWSRSDTAHG